MKSLSPSSLFPVPRAGLSWPVLIALLGACAPPHPVGTAQPTVVRVKTLAVERAAAATRYSATIRERESVDLAFKVGGTVERLLRVAAAGGERDVQEGDVLTRGSVLAELDRRDFARDVELASARLARAQADLPRASANAERWQRELARLVALEGTGAVTGKQIDETRSQARIADAEVETSKQTVATAQVELRQAEDRLSDCTLRVPVDGACVSLKKIAAGERVARDAMAFRVIDARTVRAVFGVPDLMLAGATRDQNLTLERGLDVFVQAFEGERFAGRVTKIAPAADQQTRTFLVEVTMDNAAGRLRPGMIATIQVGSERTAMLLPMTAVQRGATPGATAVFVVSDAAGHAVAQRRGVALGGVFDNQVEVLAAGSEVKPGDTVVVTNAWRLDDGRAVSVLAADAAGALR